MSDDDRDLETDEEFDFSRATQGPILPPVRGKTRITIRIDNDILDWFREQVHKQGGGNYQTMMNDALRAYMNRQPVHKIFEQVIRYREMLSEQALEEKIKAIASAPLRDPEAERHIKDLIEHARELVAAHFPPWALFVPGAGMSYENTLRKLVREVVREELARAK